MPDPVGNSPGRTALYASPVVVLVLVLTTTRCVYAARLGGMRYAGRYVVQSYGKCKVESRSMVDSPGCGMMSLRLLAVSSACSPSSLLDPLSAAIYSPSFFLHFPGSQLQHLAIIHSTTVYYVNNRESVPVTKL